MNEPKPSGCFLASRWCRLLATAIDALLVPGLTLFLVMLTGVVEHAEDFVDRWWVFHVLLLAIASYLLLNGYLLWHRGQTLGKALLGIAVIRAPADLTGLPDGTFEFVPAAFWKLVCIRALFFPLLFVGIVPYFTILPLLDQLFIFGRQRRCLHDWISGTLVVRVS